jgi:hypothetical protein
MHNDTRGYMKDFTQQWKLRKLLGKVAVWYIKQTHDPNWVLSIQVCQNKMLKQYYKHIECKELTWPQNS